MKRSEAGFTLIELMIVLVIIAMVFILGMPSYSAWIQNSRIRNAAESVHNGLQLARSEAVRRNAQVNFVQAADSGWSFGCAAVTATCPAVIQSRLASEGSAGVVVAVGNASVANTVAFNNFGASINAAGAIAINIDSATLNAAESRELRIVIETGGGTRMCDPNLDPAGSDPRRC